MVTVDRFTNNVQTYVDVLLKKLSKDNPLIGLTKPLIQRGVSKYTDDIKKYANMIADKDGNIDVVGILDEMTDSVISDSKFDIDTPFGKINIGEGKVVIPIPLSTKSVTLDLDDITELKNTLNK
jgi:hypothetical protein